MSSEWSRSEAGTEPDITRQFRGYARTTNVTTGPRSSTFHEPTLETDDEFRLPEAGQDFLGFHLLRELGRGASGRVFLARQPDMADRQVVVKVTRGRPAEAQALARLRHTNIVPIYSAHEGPGFFAICMPYDGGVTFSAVLQKLRELGEFPASGSFFSDLIPPDSPGFAVAQSTFSELTFEEAVLVIGKRLAAGLAHAHDRGLIHCDVKPANILFTDDCQPMLLDFDVAVDAWRPEARLSVVGGTLQYMSPDQFELLLGQRERIDARSDVYSLGLVLFELLSGRLPFEPPDQPSEPEIKAALGRRKVIPSIRESNPQVSSTVESIVRKCLQPEAAHRYPTAASLADDITRHLENQPLRYARENSPRERIRKWARRNPRLASPTAMVAMAAVFSLAVVAYAVRDREIERAAAFEQNRRDAHEAYSKALPHLRSIQVRLIDAAPDRARLGEIGQQAIDVLVQHGLDDPSSAKSNRVPFLSEEERDRLMEEAGVVCFFLTFSDPTRASEWLDKSQAYLADKSPTALARRRAELHHTVLPTSIPSTGLDRYLTAASLCIQGRYSEASPISALATASRPDAYTAWFLRGQCQSSLGLDAEAIGHFNACIAIRSDMAAPYYRRGKAAFRLREYRGARADFEVALHLEPEHVDSKIWHAMSSQQLKEYSVALETIDAVLAGPSPPVRAFYYRARILMLLNRKAEANECQKQALAEIPDDEASWVERGVSRLQLNPLGAIEDFQEAEKLNPRSLPAMQNQVYVYIELLRQPEKAKPVLNRILAVQPDYSPSLISRAQLAARDGNIDAACQDVERAMAIDGRPQIAFQAAGVYAALAPKREELGKKALALLVRAFRAGVSESEIDSNHDLDPIRDWPEYQSIREAAKVLRNAER